MQFSVPQFVDVRDKIFGPLTLQQFLYIVGAVGLGLVEYFTLSVPVFVILVIPTAAFFGAMAFYQINGRPFYFFLINGLNFLVSPTNRLWKRDPLLPKIKTGDSEEHSEKIQRGDLRKEGLDRLSHILDFEVVLGESIVPEDREQLYPDLY
ncbi:MAG: PrgI family protein [bacterium]|nr:PrgI family protein [bacterium]